MCHIHSYIIAAVVLSVSLYPPEYVTDCTTTVMVLELKALAESIFFSEHFKLQHFRVIYSNDTLLIYELRGKSWDRECPRILGLGQCNRSKCVLIKFQKDECTVDVPDCGSCWATDNDEVMEILASMVKNT